MIFIDVSRSNERVYSQSGFCIYRCLESSNEYSYREGFMQNTLELLELTLSSQASHNDIHW